MSEQGPTELEIAVVFGGAKPRSMDCQCSGSSVQCRAHQWRAAETVALKLDGLSRARHVREAVEGLSDEQLTPLLCNWHDGMVSGIPMGLEAEGRRRTLAAFRAALLDALTGEGK